MRMLALGQAWVDGGGRVEALLDAPETLRERYRLEGFDLRPASDEPADLLRDDPRVVAAIDRADVAVDDLTGLGEGGARTLVVDDLARLPSYPVALVLNQNAHADASQYGAVAADRLLLGLRYVLLRREFRSVPERTIPRDARHILVTFGGGDPAGMTSRALQAIDRLPGALRSGLEVRVIVGAANPDAARIASAAREATGARIIVERAVDDMVEAMSWADLAITSGGSTVWELARTGCPALVVSTVPGEVPMISGLREVDVFDALGQADRLTPADIADAIGRRLVDHEWRSHTSKRARELVDGQGAARVVDALVALPRGSTGP